MIQTQTRRRPARGGVLGRLRERRPWRPGDGAVAALVALTFLLVVGLLMGHVMRRLDPVTGDEPFYLVTAGSILHDGDIDELNNWLWRDVDAWLPPNPLPPDWQGWPRPARGFPPHASQTIQPGLYSKHGLGVPVLIVGPLAAGGRVGVVLFYGLIGALVAANIYLLARALGAGAGPALAITAALALTNPLLSYSFLIFPELPAALLTIYAFRRLLAPSNTPLQALAVGLCLAVLPWLHARLALLAVALGVMALVRWARGQTRFSLRLLLAPALASAAGLVGFYVYFYGRPWPNTQDHAGMTGSLAGWLNGVAGLLLDQQWGLLIHAPVYLLVAAGGVALARTRPAVLGWLLLVIVPYYAFIAAYNQWWGEWCPPARYLTTLAPLVAAPLAALWARGRPAVTVALVLLLSVPGLLVSVAFMLDPQVMYNHPTGRSALLLTLGARAGLDLVRFFPSFVVPSVTAADVRLGWQIGAAAAALLAVVATYTTARRAGGGWAVRR